MEELKNLLSKIVGSKYNSMSDSNIVNDQARLQNLLGKQNSDKFMDSVMAFNSDSNTSGAWKDKLQSFLNNTDPGDPGKPTGSFTPAEQKIVDQYTKLGYTVTKDASGKLQYKRNPNVGSQPQQTSAVPAQQQQASSKPYATSGGKIPLPDYSNPESRSTYAKEFRSKYGKEDYLPGFGDIPLRVNEKPAYSSSTSKELAVNAANAVGLDPALFYASSMIEGQSGLYPGARKSAGPQGVTYTGDHEYPVSGMWHFGMDSLPDYIDTLVKKGYLPKDFEEKNIKWWTKEGGPAGAHPETSMFKNTESAVKAKAAMMRQFYDELDDYAKSKNIKLSPEARDFFSLAHFNSGVHGYQMLDAYNKAGLLKNDEYLKKMPNIEVKGVSPALHKKIYGNVAPRLAAARGLKEEDLLE